MGAHVLVRVLLILQRQVAAAGCKALLEEGLP
jgi:hypothetical protein